MFTDCSRHRLSSIKDLHLISEVLVVASFGIYVPGRWFKVYAAPYPRDHPSSIYVGGTIFR